MGLGLTVAAQTVADPVLMTIGGKPITRAEFEYSYNKNAGVEGAVEQKTVDEYLDMFINYKLKVLAAEEAKMDTLSAFRHEFTTYRDMQLTPSLVDSAYIDSVAYSIYDRTVKQLDGHDLLRTSHILLRLPQQAGEADKNAAKARMDSIYNIIKGGGDFGDLARRLSQDPGSARNGGLLPWIGPGAVLKEYEDVAYGMKVGDVSEPFLTPVGWHIVKMNGRKALEPYAELRPQILQTLSRQGIDEKSAEHKMQQLTAATGKTREQILDSVMQAKIAETPSLRYLIQEYYDGLLLYEISKKDVWDVAAADEVGLSEFYKQNKKAYAWTEPRFKGFVFHCQDKAQAKQVKKVLKKHGNGDWRKAIKDAFNKEKQQVFVTGPYLSKQGENSYIDQHVFKKGEAEARKKYPYSGVYGKKLSQPKTWRDVKSLVVSDYQEKKEKEWVESLRRKYSDVIIVNKDVVKTVNKH